MNITIEENTLINKTSKAGKPYAVQQAYAHTVNSDGSPKRYPTEITLFVKKDQQGNPVPYSKGEYDLADSSFEVDQYGNLSINFVNLIKRK